MSNSCVIVVGQLQNTTMAVWLPFVVSSEWQYLPLGGAEHHHLGVGGEPQHLPPLGEQNINVWAWVVRSTITPQEKQSIAVQAWAGVGHADAAVPPWGSRTWL